MEFTYTHLTPERADGLRHERIRSLEIEHFRLSLALSEAPEDSELGDRLTDLESRIVFQREMAGVVLSPPVRGAQGGADTPGSDDEADQCARRVDPVPMTTAYDDDDACPEGLETKSVNPEFGHTTVATPAEEPTAGEEETGGEAKPDGEDRSGTDPDAAGASDGGTPEPGTA